MTYLANLENHPQKTKLIDIDTQKGFKYQEELFKQVKEQKKNLFQFDDWIKQHIDNTLKEL